MEIDRNGSDEEIEKAIDEYMEYYRYHRYQKGLNGMTPYEYGQSLLKIQRSNCPTSGIRDNV